MTIRFTAYADKKFEMLKRHGCIIPRDSVRDAAESGAMNTEAAGQSLFFAQKKWEAGRAVRVAYKKEAGAIRIITFYPVASDE